MTLIITCGIIINEMSETPYEQCINKCPSYNQNCIDSCNNAVIKVVEDLTSSIDKINWEEIINKK